VYNIISSDAVSRTENNNNNISQNPRYNIAGNITSEQGNSRAKVESWRPGERSYVYVINCTKKYSD